MQPTAPWLVPSGQHPPSVADVQTKPLHILIGVDSSAHTLAGARFARDLRLPPGSCVTAAAVLDPNHLISPLELDKALRRVADLMHYNGIPVATHLLQGCRAEQLIRFAQVHATDLVLIGATGLHSRLGIFLRGDPQQVVEATRCPVLVARTPYTRLRHVLLVMDGAWYSMRAARYLAQLSFATPMRVTVMHVQPRRRELNLDTAIPQPQQFNADYGAGVWSLLGWLHTGLRAKDMTLHTSRAILRYATGVLHAANLKVDTVVTQGDVATEVVQYAHLRDVDLIVAGAGSPGWISSWATGDVSRRIIHGAGCSVLIVKA